MRLVLLGVLLVGSTIAPISAEADTVPVLPTCNGSTSVRPGSIDLYCNGRAVMTGIHWDYWGRFYATGHGVVVEKSCAPKLSQPGAYDCFATKLSMLITTESRTRPCRDALMYTRYVVYDDTRTFASPSTVPDPVQIFTTSC
jgi:hypothetical protein